MPSELQNTSRFGNIKLTVSTTVHDAEWDQFILETPDGHYTQTALWGEIKKTQGWSPLRLIFKDEQGIVGGAQLLIRKLPLFGYMGYVSKGPVCRTGDIDLNKKILQETIEVCKKQRVAYLAIQPPDHSYHIVPILIEMGMNESTQGDLEKPATILIDLRPDEEGILAQIKSNRRRYIRVSQKQGFAIRQGKREDLDIFTQLHEATGERSRFETQSKEFFEKLWDVFEPRGYVDLLIEEYGGQPVAACLNIKFKKTGFYFQIGWSGEHSDKHPNEGLFWNSFLWTKLQGCEVYDMGGIDKNAAKALLNDDPLPEIFHGSYTEYKSRYSKNIVLYPETYEKILNPTLFWAYQILNGMPPVKKFMQSIYKRTRRR